MANRDLEFILKFRNEAKATIKQAQADLSALGKTASQVNQSMKGFAASSNQVSASLTNSTTATQKAALAQAKLDLQQQKLVLESNKLSTATDKLALDQQKLSYQTEKLAYQQQRLAEQKKKATQQSNLFGGSIFNLTRQFIPLTAAFAALKTINIADQFVLQQARIENATESVAEYEKAFAGLRDISRETGAGMEATVSIFQRLSFVRKEIGATVDEMLQFTNTVAQLGVISGASPDALKFGLTQLGQSLSSDIVRAEEFNSIMENIPAVGKQIADEFGITTGQLRKLVIEGEVLSEDVFAAVLNAAQKVEEEFAKFPETVGRAFQGFLLDLGFAVDGLNKTSNASKILIEVIFRAGKAIAALADIVVGFSALFKVAFTALIGDIVGIYIKAMGKIEDLVNGSIKALNVFRKEGNKIQLVDFVDVDAFTQAIDEDVSKSFKEAGEAFKSAASNADKVIGGENGAFGSMFGVKAEEVAKATRVLKKNYGDLANGIGETNKKANEFYRTLAEQVAALQEETKWVGRSNKERERAISLMKVQQDAVKAGITNFDPTEFLAAYDALEAAKDRVKNDFGTGLKAAMTEFVESTRGAGDLARDLFNKTADGISSTIKGLVDGSINSFDDLRTSLAGIMKDIAADILEFVIRQQIVGQILGLFGGSTGATFQSNPNIAGTSYMLTAAKGAALKDGVQFFAKGGITNGPMAFPMASGTGVAGENGRPEGILPLARMPGGDLGVQATGSGGGTMLNYSPTISISIGDSGGSGVSPEAMQQLSKMIDNETRRTVLEIITKEQRNGGLLAGGRNTTA